MISSRCLVLLFAFQFSALVKTLPVENGDFKVVCFFPLQTWYAPDSRDYSPDIIDDTQCTHVIMRERISIRNGTVSPFLNDGKEYFHRRAGELQAKGIHVPLSIFKYNLYQHVNRLPTTEERTEFVKSLVAFNKQYNFTGFDFRWFVDCRGCENADSHKLNADSMDLVRQLSEAFKPNGWILLVNVIGNKTEIDTIDIPQLEKYVDFVVVHVMGPKGKAALQPPLYASPNNPSDQSNYDWAIKYLIEKGIPARKVLLPVSTIITLYTLISDLHGLNAPARDSWQNSLHEICEKTKANNWTIVHGSDQQIGSYAYLGNQWNAYNDVEDIQRRADFVRQHNLGGGEIMSINNDDFQNVCGCGKYPLLTALARVLRNPTAPRLNNCT